MCWMFLSPTTPALSLKCKRGLFGSFPCSCSTSIRSATTRNRYENQLGQALVQSIFCPKVPLQRYEICAKVALAGRTISEALKFAGPFMSVAGWESIGWLLKTLPNLALHNQAQHYSLSQIISKVSSPFECGEVNTHHNSSTENEELPEEVKEINLCHWQKETNLSSGSLVRSPSPPHASCCLHTFETWQQMYKDCIKIKFFNEMSKMVILLIFTRINYMLTPKMFVQNHLFP